MKTKLTTLLLLISLIVNGQYYVTTSGSSFNDGLSEGSAWSLDHAFSSAVPGDIINVKAGNYGAITSKSVSISGTLANPISFIGYKTVPNDIVAFEGSTFNFGDAISNIEAPAIRGTVTNLRPDQEEGLLLTGDYLVFKNFQFEHYFRPLQSSGDGNHLDNIYCYKGGTHNTTDFVAGFGTTFPNGVYSGQGIKISGDNIKVTNTLIVDQGAEGIRWSNTDNAFGAYIDVYSTASGSYANAGSADLNDTDYHFLCSVNVTNSTFKNCSVNNGANFITAGHGFVVKPDDNQPSYNITFEDFYVNNTKIETQFPETYNVTFKNGIIEAIGTGGRIIEVEANISNGSYDVLIENVIFKNGAHLAVRGWNEVIHDDNYLEGAIDLTVKNCYFKGNGTQYAIMVTYGPNNEPLFTSKRITLDHCTIDNFPHLFSIDSANEDIVITNSIINNTPSYSYIRYMDGTDGKGGPFTLDDSYTAVNFYNGFSARTGVNITTLNPSLIAGQTTNSTLLTSGAATTNYVAGLPLGYLGVDEYGTTNNQKRKNSIIGVIN